MSASGETMVSATRILPGPLRTELDVGGMDCQNCARHVREALEGVPGVCQVSVDLPSHRATVRWGRDFQPDTQAAIQAVTQAGYEPRLVENREAVSAPKRRLLGGWSGNVIIGLPVTVFLMLGEWVFGLAHARWFQWLAFALATVVQVFAGARFYRGAWAQFKARSANMDTLVVLGSTTAYAYSIWALIQGTHVFFMEAAAIITLISLGHWMEARMSERAASSIKKLLSLTPQQARVLRADGSEEMVPSEALQEGDRIVLRPGERVPADGKVIDGVSAVDEAMLTGESMPVDKSPGELIYGGTMNLNARLVVRVTATGGATALAHIAAAVERAQNSRASIQRIGDRVSSVFVPVVVLVALVAGLWWGLAPEPAKQTATFFSKFLWPVHFADTALALAIMHAAAVLIIACPCAMGLATPAAIMAGANAAAERGILIRDGVALEKAGTISAVVFDKTGTLTHGRPALTKKAEFAGEDGVSATALAAALARHSNHPLSRALALADNDAVTSATLALVNWKEVGGSGIEATLEGHSVRLGSIRWLAEAGVELPSSNTAELWAAEGATVVAVSMGKRLRGLFALQDTIKEDAREMIAQLKRAGQRVYLVTGDNRRTAEAIGRLLDIDPMQVAAEVRPERKAEFVSQLQQRGERVAFVGDGINDAPALEQADLGVAIGRAADIAQMAADIVLLNSDVHAIPRGLGLARATLRTIKQNLFWAFFYNAAAIPLAALGFLSPVLCALTMGLSDVVVIGNALRLRRWRG